MQLFCNLCTPKWHILHFWEVVWGYIFVFWGEAFPNKIASAVDGICVGIVIDTVTVAVSITVAVSVAIAVAKRLFFQDPFS